MYPKQELSTPTGLLVFRPLVQKKSDQNFLDGESRGHDGVPFFYALVLFIYMACNYYEITNFNSVEDGYYRWTGCTGGIISVNSLSPLDRVLVCAEDLIQEDYGAPLTIQNTGLCPSATPTPTMTSSVTPTPTVTPTQHSPTPTATNTPTPTLTPTPIFIQCLITGGWYQNVCNSINFGTPCNVVVYSYKPFHLLRQGDQVFGNKELTIPPVGAQFTITDGATFIQVVGTEIINFGLCG